jgi:succinate dehydrogenase/fumarate reductase flavoprotein subunit
MQRGKIIGMCSHFGEGVKLFNGLGERYMEKYDPNRMEFATRDVASRGGFTEIREGRGTKNGTVIVDPRDHDPKILNRFKTSVPHIYKMFRNIYGDSVAEWQEAFEVVPSQHFFMGGLKIDEECKTNVPGLFAVGEVAGGVHGANRLSGVALTELYVMGPISGESVARFASSNKRIPIDAEEAEHEIKQFENRFKTGPGVRPFELKSAIQKIMWENLGPVRDSTGIRSAIDALNDLREQDLARMVIGSNDNIYNRDKREAVEVPFMLETALMVARSALVREESRGSHFRTDFPSRNDEKWLKNIVLRKIDDNSMDLQLENIIKVDEN